MTQAKEADRMVSPFGFQNAVLNCLQALYQPMFRVTTSVMVSVPSMP